MWSEPCEHHRVHDYERVPIRDRGEHEIVTGRCAQLGQMGGTQRDPLDTIRRDCEPGKGAGATTGSADVRRLLTHGQVPVNDDRVEYPGLPTEHCGERTGLELRLDSTLGIEDAARTAEREPGR